MRLLQEFFEICFRYRCSSHRHDEWSYESRITFTEEQRSAFQRLKDLLSRATDLHVSLYDRQFIVSCEASDYAVGACLSRMDDCWHEHPLAFASANLSNTQIHWSILEKEAYAVVFALQGSTNHLQK